MKSFRQIWDDIRQGENIDLYLTILAAILFVILNLAGLAPDTFLAPLTLSVLALLAVTTFLPIAFVHPVRVERWRPVTLTVTAAWFVFAGIALAEKLSPPDSVAIGLLVTTLYLALGSGVQQLLDLVDRARRGL